MTFSDTQAALGLAVAARVPVLLWGAPGQGKTSTIEALAAANNMHLETVLASIREPSDFAGLPYVVDGKSTLLAPDWAQAIVAATGRGERSALFLDEVSTATPAVQAALLRVVLDRKVGDTYLGDDVAVIAAANPPEIAADGWDLAPPMANRFLHLDWALPSDVVSDGFLMEWPEVVVPVVDEDRLADEVRAARQLVGAFLRARPDLTTVMPTASSEAGRAYPTPRSWETAATMFGYARAAGASAVAVRMLLVGSIGQGAAVEFLAYINDLDLPTPQDVIANPDTFAVPTRGDRVYAVAYGALSYVKDNMSDDTWNAMGTVLKRVAEANHADIAVAVATPWMKCKPDTARPDAETLRALSPILKEAGLIGAAPSRTRKAASAS